MININLLSISAYKQKLKGRIFLMALFLLLVIGCAGFFSLKFFILDTHISRLTSQSQQLQAELQMLKNKVTAATKQTEVTVSHWKQLVAIMSLEERRRDQARLMAGIEELVPKDSAWLISMEHKNGLLTLNGISKDKDTISELLTRLQNAPYLNRPSVFLREINQNMRINNILLTSFSINARTSFPEPTIMDEGMPQFNLPSSVQFAELVKNAAPTLAVGLEKK